MVHIVKDSESDPHVSLEAPDVTPLVHLGILDPLLSSSTQDESCTVLRERLSNLGCQIDETTRVERVTSLEDQVRVSILKQSSSVAVSRDLESVDWDFDWVVQCNADAEGKEKELAHEPGVDRLLRIRESDEDGIQSALDLAWRLGLVFKGVSRPSLLKGYGHTSLASRSELSPVDGIVNRGFPAILGPFLTPGTHMVLIFRDMIDHERVVDVIHKFPRGNFVRPIIICEDAAALDRFRARTYHDDAEVVLDTDGDLRNRYTHNGGRSAVVVVRPDLVVAALVNDVGALYRCLKEIFPYAVPL